MTLLNDVINLDAAAFADAEMSPGVESITFVFPDNTERPVSGHVFRNGTKEIPGATSGVSPAVEIAVWNHATLGLLASEVTVNLKAKVNLKLDGNLVTMTVIRPGPDGKWNIDEGMLRLGLR